MIPGTEVETSGLVYELLVALGLQLVPELVGTPEQRHVAWVLEVRLADHPAVPVRAPERVTERVLLDPERPHPARREVRERRAPHRAHPDDHGMKCGVCHPRPS